MARHCQSAFVAVLVALLLGSSNAQNHDQCMNFFGGLGGKQEFLSMAPSCEQGMRGFRACCSEVKDMIGKAPEGCLCDGEVWEELVQKFVDAGINGLNRDTINTFANLCGIPTAATQVAVGFSAGAHATAGNTAAAAAAAAAAATTEPMGRGGLKAT